jgi:hypothetical protein
MSDVRPSDSLQNAPDVTVGPTPDLLAQALAITAEIYSGPIDVEEEFDPEHPEIRWRVIMVQDSGSLAEVMERKNRWHRRMILELVAPAPDITICVRPTLQ